MPLTQVTINRRTAFDRQRGYCFWCGVELLWYKEVKSQTHSQLCTAEHLIPKGQGGNNRHWNIVAACFKCNNARKDNSLETWLHRLKFRLEKSGTPQRFDIVLSNLKSRGIATPFSPHPMDK